MFAGHLRIAQGMKALQDEHGWAVRQIAAEVGCGKSTVHNHLQWLALGDDRPTYGERIKAIKGATPAPEPVVEPEPVKDWSLAHSPAERFASHLATAVQAIEAAYAEVRANPRKFTGHPMRIADQIDLIKVRARAIEARVRSLAA